MRGGVGVLGWSAGRWSGDVCVTAEASAALRFKGNVMVGRKVPQGGVPLSALCSTAYSLYKRVCVLVRRVVKNFINHCSYICIPLYYIHVSVVCCCLSAFMCA